MDLIEKAAQKLKQASSASLLERAAPQLQQEEAAQIVAAAAAPATHAKKADHAARHSRRSRLGMIDFDRLRGKHYITPDSKPNRMWEEYRIAKRSLLLNAFAKGDSAIRNGNLILVTSAQPSEGKSFCAINLAMSIASERDLTVLLVDADFARPKVLTELGLEGDMGFIDVVADPSVSLADCMIRTNIENLSVLPAGRPHHLTTELLASERMGLIVEEIAKRYRDRVIIFDSPPTLASSIPSVLAMHVGQTVFVVEAERTREPQIKEALSLLNSCRHISLLLNKSRFSGEGERFGTYDYYYSVES